jgi:aminotransferase
VHSKLARALSERSDSFLPGLRREVLSAGTGIDDLIALARGDPDFPTPQNIAAAASRAAELGWTHYTPWNGVLELRVAIAEKLERDNNLTVDPDDEIAVTGGAQEALFIAMQMLVGPGDEVLLPDPHYSAYAGAIALSGATAVLVPTRGENRFELEIAELEAKLSPRTKLLVLVDPSNPAGAVLSGDQAAAVAAWVAEHDLLVLADEVYESLVFDGRSHTSIASLSGMADRTVSIFSFSKTYAMTGWRVGYLVGPSEFIARAGELHYVVSICASAPSQLAALEALRGPQTVVGEMVASYERRRNFLASAIESIGWSCPAPHGGFSVMADIRHSGLSSMEMFRYLLKEARVQGMPGVLYGPSGEGYVRISVLAPQERLEEAVVRIGAAAARLKSDDPR